MTVCEERVRRLTLGDGGAEGGADGGGGSTDGDGGSVQVTMDAIRGALPEDLRSHPSVAKAEKPEDFIRQAINAERLVGVDPSRVVTVPLEGDDEGFRGALHKLGLPDTTEGYKLRAPQDKDGKPIEAFDPSKSALARSFVEKAHEAGVMPKQAQALYDWMVGHTQETMQAREKQADEAFHRNVATLRERWGDNYDANVALADFAAGKMGIAEKLNRAGLGHDPDVLQALARYGKMLGEDHDVGGSAPGNSQMAAREQGMELLRRAAGERNPHEAKRLNQEAQAFFRKARGE